MSASCSPADRDFVRSEPGGTGGTGAGDGHGPGVGGTSGGSGCALETQATDCDDDNPCTADACAAGACVHVPFDGVSAPPSAQVAGDCQLLTCVTGQPSQAIDDSDVPDDDNECAVETCEGGVPTSTSVPDGAPCGQSTDCIAYRCEAGACIGDEAPEGTPITTQARGDCMLSICDGAGGITSTVDTTDLPDDGNPCTSDECHDGVPTNVAPAGVVCCFEDADCPRCHACGGGGACELAAPDTRGLGCAEDQVCDAAGECKGPNGQACASGAACASGHCVDGVCCNTSCSATCTACNVFRSVGTCSDILRGRVDPRCSSNELCDGEGTCKLAGGEPCFSNTECASGVCYRGSCTGFREAIE
ncbi:uncharacterized protein SOCEGT47_043820 [Sorangium cellulosum]|uniref:Uncharacterized protein n=1 Tax=Sorangium cellulosum TaxID=56 RepID=A0A4V0NDU1_SORCE|nr:uncharacterized protein SOCEGT47_043820 [Sorangium cellulosum]